MNFSRRDLALLLPAVAAAQQAPQKPSAPMPSKMFPFSELTARQSGPLKLYQILTGDTHSGFHIDLHESELAPGAEPHAPHSHGHEEMVLVREGELEITISGRKTILGPGSGAYMASNEMHGYHNGGAVPAKYFVLELGSDK